MKHYSATLALLPLTLALFLPQAAHAHGSMETPPSRVYGCFLEGPENPKSAACKAAVAAGGTQALYDWNGVNQGNANGNHQAVVPDGQLCGAGKALFKGLNLARSDWPSTAIAPDARGNFQFVYKASAPHATRYFDFYITKDGYNPEKPLAWSDLEPAPFCSITSVKLENGTYRMNCPLPQGKTGKHVIYNVWQRSDSPEAFYACIDVSFSGAVANPWQALGNLRAQQDLPAGATVTLRLFDAQGRDAQRHSLTLAQGANGAKQWPLALAQKVNQDSTLVNIGVLDAYGAVSPVASSQDNQVYVRQAGYRFQVDIELPVEGGGEQPGGDGKVDFDYPQGLQQYDAGTVVRGADGKRYQCKPYPNSGWCKGWDLYYAPGKGMAWQDAWTLL
ncbi:chitin-binding protein CbpD [Pseudomonas aeruginosa]|nr:chitin-binding protein CbpD [Pseudomonas aeruginosa]